MKTQFKSIILLSILYLLFSTTIAQTQDLETKTAEEVLNKYIEATGGIDNYDKIKSRKTNSEINIQGLVMNMKILQTKPNNYYSILESPAIGKIESGSNGSLAWTISEQTGPILKKGSEKTQFMASAWLDQYVYWNKVYKNIVLEGSINLDSIICYHLKLYITKDICTDCYFRADNGLLHKVSQTLSSQVGEFHVESYYSDYRESDGVLLPFHISVFIGDQKRVIRVISIDNNVNIDPEIFLPEEIKTID